MYHFFVEPSQIHTNDNTVVILGSDVNHIKNVLRMKPGEEIAVSNGGDGREYRCGIKELNEESILCELRFIKEDGVELPSRRTRRRHNGSFLDSDVRQRIYSIPHLLRALS